MHQLMAETLDTMRRGHPAHPAPNARSQRLHLRPGPRWPMIVLKLAQGVDRAKGGRRAARSREPSARTRCRSWSTPRTQTTSPTARSVDEAATRPRNCSTPTAGYCRSSPPWLPSGTDVWAPTPTPTAASCCTTCGCPTSGITRSTVPSPGAVTAQDTMVLGKFLRDVVRLEPGDAQLPHLRTRTRHCRTCSAAVFEVTDRQWDAREVADDEFLAPSPAASSTRCSANTSAKAGWKATC